MAEHVSRNFKDQRSTAFHFFNPVVNLYYFTSTYGQGFFGHIDLGYSEMHEYIERGDPYFNIYRGGFGQLGLGYGIPATYFSDLLIEARAFYIPLENSRYFSGGLLSLGFLLHR